MVALRKDVKLGLTLGGIVLSVVGVYVGLTALAGDKGAGNGAGASLHADAAGSAAKPAGSAAGTGTKTPPATPIDAPRGNSSSNQVADLSHSNGTAPVGPSGVAPGTPIVASAQHATPTGGDPWDDSMFQTGQLGSGSPRVTETPDPAKVASNQPRSGGTPASPSDIIQQLNGPRTGNGSAPVTPAAGNGSTATASANDASGAMTTGTTAQLTQITKHVVANGDTLSTIAAQYYGNAKYYQLIADANPSVNPSRLKIGQELKIPAGPTATETTSSTANVPVGTATAGSTTSSKGPIDPTKQYVVKAKDSLQKIASTLYGDSAAWEKIYDANKAAIGSDPAKLKLGMVLTLPTPPTKHS